MVFFGSLTLFAACGTHAPKAPSVGAPCAVTGKAVCNAGGQVIVTCVYPDCTGFVGIADARRSRSGGTPVRKRSRAPLNVA
jgi:hypothetical protein